jgi:hypothetical protein
VYGFLPALITLLAYRAIISWTDASFKNATRNTTERRLQRFQATTAATANNGPGTLRPGWACLLISAEWLAAYISNAKPMGPAAARETAARLGLSYER